MKLFIKNVEEEDWTVSNLLVNPDLRQNPALLKFRKDEHSEDYPAMVKLKAAFEEKIYTLNPNVETPLCFTDYYKNLVSPGSQQRLRIQRYTCDTDAGY